MILTKKIVCGRRSFYGPVKNINGQLLIHDDEKLMVLNYMTSGVSPTFVIVITGVSYT